jgi:dTDP-4-dehydrorhamnose 3,5-epimerase
VIGARLTELRRIPTPGGDVLHAVKSGDPGFAEFGEAYLTTIEHGFRKGWKRHTRMVMNLVVAHGHVRFCVHDERTGQSQAFDLSPDEPGRHARLTVEPGLWMAFEGLGPGLNVILNVASIRHDPAEAENRPIEAFATAWPR